MTEQQLPELMSVYRTVQKDHPAIDYYKREDISLVLSKGLAVTCRQKPRNPIEFFGNWLNEYADVQKKAKALIEEERTVAKLKEKHEFVVRSQQAEVAEKRKKEQRMQELNDKFWGDLEASEEVVILLTMGSAGRDLLMLSGLLATT